MKQVGVTDPYSDIALIKDGHFELRGSELAVPLYFQPTNAFILETLLSEGQITKSFITRSPEYDELCAEAYPSSRFSTEFPRLQYVFRALGPTLIQETGQNPTRIYMKNPIYVVIDERVEK